MKTIPNIANLLKILDNVITKHFMPYITGGIKCSDVKRRFLPLQPSVGGLGIPIFSEIADFDYTNSRLVTETLTRKVINQERQCEQNSRIKEIKNKITGIRHQRHSDILKSIKSRLPEQQ